MNTIDLIHSLTIDGFKLGLRDSETLEIRGPSEKLTVEQKESLSECKAELIQIVSTCIPFEDREREAIQFADTQGAIGPLSECMRYFDNLAGDMNRNNPNTLETVAQGEPGDECRYCGSEQTFLAIIHDGESLRRDCAGCGRFIEFPAWYDAGKADDVLRRSNAYNETNEQGALTPSSL